VGLILKEAFQVWGCASKKPFKCGVKPQKSLSSVGLSLKEAFQVWVDPQRSLSSVGLILKEAFQVWG